jgi:class 3 adenylate cyclase
MAARALPTGTVTFLFSDMEGSTRLVQDLGPAAFTQVLDQHNAILRKAFSGHGGVERGTQGDSFLVMFPEAPAAASAAAEAQIALADAAWPAGTPVRVRMGLHTGIGTLGGDDYVSVDVNRAARIAALAHGGQVLVSDATRALVEGALPTGVSLRALGEFGLKDLARPERLHQLVIEGVRSEFPPLRPIDRSAIFRIT